jgi:hypothetical protein
MLTQDDESGLSLEFGEEESNLPDVALAKAGIQRARDERRESREEKKIFSPWLQPYW